MGLQSRVLCVQAWAKASLGAHLRAAEAVNQRLKAVAYVLQVGHNIYMNIYRYRYRYLVLHNLLT